MPRLDEDMKAHRILRDAVAHELKIDPLRDWAFLMMPDKRWLILVDGPDGRNYLLLGDEQYRGLSLLESRPFKLGAVLYYLAVIRDDEDGDIVFMLDTANEVKA